MTLISLLMFTRNDVEEGIANIELTKDYVDEIIIIEQSGPKEKSKMTAYAKTNPKVKMYNAVALGMPQPYKTWAIKKCNGDYILLLDADEMPSNRLLKFLQKRDFKKDIYLLYRHEVSLGNLRTWQLRLWKKGAVEWTGNSPHEHPKRKGSTAKLSKEAYLLHKQNNQPRTYNKFLEQFDMENRIWVMGRGSYMLLSLYGPRGLSKLPKEIINGLKGKQQTKQIRELSKYLKTKGITNYLELDKDSVVEGLYKKYYGKREGADLLITLLLEKWVAK